MKKYLFGLLVLGVFVSVGLLLPHSAALAESPIWITAGVGPGNARGVGSAIGWFAGRIAASWYQGPGQWTITYSSCGEAFNIAGLGTTLPREHASDLGVLYGKHWSQPRLGFVSVNGGAAL
jgi:hypothetical protein